MRVDPDSDDALAAAAAAVRRGGTVVYPTETVYGLGADALSPSAVERVFELKDRPRERPLSLAVPDVAAALRHTDPSPRAEAFMREFLPGPVTVVVPRGEAVPDELTAGRDRVGVRVPDHDLALALLREVAPTPVTATSANVSGSPSAVRLADLDAGLRERVDVLVDGGETGGAESTVVDPETGEVHRRGANADAVAAWLDEHPDG